MNRARRAGALTGVRLGCSGICLLLGLLTTFSASAQSVPPPSGGSYRISKQVIAAGGERSSGGAYALTGTVAQAAVDPITPAAGPYRLNGGFHTPKQPRPDGLFSNGFEN